MKNEEKTRSRDTGASLESKDQVQLDSSDQDGFLEGSHAIS